MDVVQRVDRRGFLSAAAALLATTTGPAFGQTLIQDTANAGFGFSRPQTSEVAASAPAAPTAAASQPAAQAVSDWRRFLLQGERVISMRRDGATQRVRYCSDDGLLDRQGYAQACLLLRDVHANVLFPMDPRLLDVLCGLQRWAAYNGHAAIIQVNSGFRSKSTNANTEGAMRNSMHLYGRAADIVLEGFTSALLGAMVLEFNRQGGTGIYLGRGFVHVDTGPARSWVSSAPRRRL